MLGNPCTLLYLLRPFLWLRDGIHSVQLFPNSEHFSWRFRSVVYTVVKLGLFASKSSQMSTVCGSLSKFSPLSLPPTSSIFVFWASLHLYSILSSPLSILFPPVSCFHCLSSSISPVPRVVAVSPQMRLVEDNPSSLSLVEIYKQRCAKKGIEHDNPISRYYDRLATVQARGTQASHQVQIQSCQ